MGDQLLAEKREINAEIYQLATVNCAMSLALLALAGLWIAGAVRWARATSPQVRFRAKLMTGICVGLWGAGLLGRRCILQSWSREIRTEQNSWEAQFASYELQLRTRGVPGEVGLHSRWP
jgi:hypothetical protein